MLFSLFRYWQLPYIFLQQNILIRKNSHFKSNRINIPKIFKNLNKILLFIQVLVLQIRLQNILHIKSIELILH